MLWRLPTGADPTYGRSAQEAGVSNTFFPLRPQQEEARDKKRANRVLRTSVSFRAQTVLCSRQ